MTTSSRSARTVVVPLGLLVAALAAGCGEIPPSASATTTSAGDAGRVPGPPPVAAIRTGESSPGAIRTVGAESAPKPVPSSAREPEIGGAKVGSAAWYLDEIDVLRTKSLPRGGDAKSLAKAMEDRNLEIVQLALQAIVLTHEDGGSESLFNEAARRLFEARLQLALTGNEEHGRQLYADARDFHERNPNSTASAVGAHTLLRYAKSNAAKFGSKDREWIEEYSRQARLFATNYPGEAAVAAPALAGAGRTCELHGMTKEAVRCYGLLQDRYPRTDEGRLAAGALRRLSLPGKPFALKGSTLDGGFTSIEDHRGRVVLVAFWNSAAKPFREQLPAVQTLEAKYGRFGLNVVGVNLDTEQDDVEAFLEKTPMSWPSLFHSDPKRRGWQHPVAEWYGVRDVPTYVVVDHTGIARHVGTDAADLETPIRDSLLALRDAARGTQP